MEGQTTGMLNVSTAENVGEVEKYDFVRNFLFRDNVGDIKCDSDDTESVAVAVAVAETVCVVDAVGVFDFTCSFADDVTSEAVVLGGNDCWDTEADTVSDFEMALVEVTD